MLIEDTVGLEHKSCQHHANELTIVSYGYLPNILAQHLFTSFMWTVVERLPSHFVLRRFSYDEQDVEVVDRQVFDPNDFVDTWHSPTLKHRQLTSILQQLEDCGFSNQREALLCMVPALSSKDLLPNDSILDLIPNVRNGLGWEKIAHYYNRLLETPLRTEPVERLRYSVIVATMDFVYMSCEPYIDFIMPPDGLKAQIEDLVARLLSADFVAIVRSLAPAFTLQRRNMTFLKIFRRFGTTGGIDRLKWNNGMRRQFRVSSDLSTCLQSYESGNTEMNATFSEKVLGFPKDYRELYQEDPEFEPIVFDLNGNACSIEAVQDMFTHSSNSTQSQRSRHLRLDTPSLRSRYAGKQVVAAHLQTENSKETPTIT